MNEDQHEGRSADGWPSSDGPPSPPPPLAGPAPRPADSRLSDMGDTGEDWPTQPTADGMVVPPALQHEARNGGGLRRFASSGLVRLGVVGAVLGGGALWGAIQGADRDESGQIVDAGDVDVFDLQVGDCLEEPDGEEITSVRGLPCSEPHDFEVYHNHTLTSSAVPTEDQVGPLVEQHCLPAFETYVGIPYAEHPTLYVDAFWPSEESWAEGDRALTCIVFDSNGPLTDSVRAS